MHITLSHSVFQHQLSMIISVYDEMKYTVCSICIHLAAAFIATVTSNLNRAFASLHVVGDAQ